MRTGSRRLGGPGGADGSPGVPPSSCAPYWELWEPTSALGRSLWTAWRRERRLSPETDLRPAETEAEGRCYTLNTEPTGRSGSGSGFYLTGLQDVDLLFVDGVSVLLQEALTLILHLQRQH